MNRILFFIILLFLFNTLNCAAALSSESSAPKVTNDQIQEYKDFIESRQIREKEIPELKQEIKTHEKDKNYKTNIKRALAENSKSENGYRIQANCGMKNDIKILISYSVIYDSNQDKEYIYSVSGNLIQIAYKYPEYKAVYSNLGKLTRIIFQIQDGYFCFFSGKGAFQGVVDEYGNLYNRNGTMQNDEPDSKQKKYPDDSTQKQETSE